MFVIAMHTVAHYTMRSAACLRILYRAPLGPGAGRQSRLLPPPTKMRGTHAWYAGLARLGLPLRRSRCRRGAPKRTGFRKDGFAQRMETLLAR